MTPGPGSYRTDYSTVGRPVAVARVATAPAVHIGRQRRFASAARPQPGRDGIYSDAAPTNPKLPVGFLGDAPHWSFHGGRSRAAAALLLSGGGASGLADAPSYLLDPAPGAYSGAERSAFGAQVCCGCDVCGGRRGFVFRVKGELLDSRRVALLQMNSHHQQQIRPPLAIPPPPKVSSEAASAPAVKVPRAGRDAFLKQALGKELEKVLLCSASMGGPGTLGQGSCLGRQTLSAHRSTRACTFGTSGRFSDREGVVGTMVRQRRSSSAVGGSRGGGDRAGRRLSASAGSSGGRRSVSKTSDWVPGPGAYVV